MADSVAGGRRELSILVVDDDDVLREAIRRAFDENGEHRVLACGSFDAARNELHAAQYDVLLTDVRLGAFNGLQLAVLARDLNPDIDIIVFSGYDDPVLRQEAERLGATFFVKPVSALTLLQRIRR
jgi:two-component system response regulator YesN